MRSFMDEVEWSNHAGGGMVVKMVKSNKTAILSWTFVILIGLKSAIKLN